MVKFLVEVKSSYPDDCHVSISMLNTSLFLCNGRVNLVSEIDQHFRASKVDDTTFPSSVDFSMITQFIAVLMTDMDRREDELCIHVLFMSVQRIFQGQNTNFPPWVSEMRDTHHTKISTCTRFTALKCMKMFISTYSNSNQWHNE